MPELRSNGQAIDVGTLRLRTPGLRGRAEAIPPLAAGFRAPTLESTILTDALAQQGVTARHLVEITVTSNTPQPPAASGLTRGRFENEPVLELEVPSAGQTNAQVVLSIDEGGVVTWNFPVNQPAPVGGVSRAVGNDLFQIRSRSPVAPAEPGTRGVFGTIGKKLLRVLVFPLVEMGARAVADDLAERWESDNRPYRLRGFDPATFVDANAPDIDGAGWAKLGSGPALLFLHGTFSRAHSAFGRFDPAAFAALHAAYEGRVFAFDHFTLAHDPVRNVEEFVRSLPEDIRLDLDIVSHSRGGLVGRVLTELQSGLSLGNRTIAVRKHVFTAVPNKGTALADMTYMGDLVDAYTNLMQFFPDNGVTEILEGVILTVKHIAAGFVSGLPGLQAMRPDGDFYQRLNVASTSTARYFALASNYEPVDAGLKAWAKDRLFDVIFRDANDLVVPTLGVYEDNGSSHFAIDSLKRFDTSDGIAHSGFFGHGPATEQIHRWLVG